MDMFTDPMAELLARIEALEAAVFAKPARPARPENEAVDEPLMAAWAAWEGYRRGKGWTAKARALNMRKLRELAGTDGVLAHLIVNQSIEFGYQGLFPLKGQEKGSKLPPPMQHKTVKEALAPTEDKRTAHLAWLWNQVERGELTKAEYEAAKAGRA